MPISAWTRMLCSLGIHIWTSNAPPYMVRCRRCQTVKSVFVLGD